MTRYCSSADLQLAMPQMTLVMLSNDDPVATDINADIVTLAITQAEELVDAHLRGRYKLPLVDVPTVVKEITVNLARHWLYARRPEGAEIPEAVTRTWKQALEHLGTIRDGKLTLGIPTTGQDAPEPGEVKVRVKRATFSQSLLDKYR